MNNKYPAVGIDVAKEFCYFAILGPDSKVYVNPTKIMNDESGWDSMLESFKKAEEAFNEKPTILLESTGHFSESLVRFLIKNDYRVFLINPLQSHSIKSSGIRKAKTDKLDCLDIARLYFLIDLREYVMPDEYISNLKILTRAHFHLSEQRVLTINQLTAALDQAMPNFTKIFSNIYKKSVIELLLTYNSPDSLLKSKRENIVNLIKTTSRKTVSYANEKLMACAKSAKRIGIALDALYQTISIYAGNLKHIDGQLLKLQESINSLSINIPSIRLLKSIPGIGDKLAPIIAAEIGDISRFNSAKQLVAYCGIDPSVKQSGNFTGSKNKFTKRGSPYIRKALYIAATISVKHKDEKYTNQVMYEYYHKKTQSKAKKQALGAVMNKLARIIFSILKNDHEFISITPEQQVRMYQNKLKISA
jgi:transposase